LAERDARLGQTQKMAEAAASRLAEHMNMEMKMTIEKHETNTKRMQTLEGWMTRRERDMAHARMVNKEQFSDRSQQVADTQAAKAQERQKAAARNEQKIEKAREDAAQNWANLASSAREKRNLRMEKWKRNKQAQNRDTKRRDQLMMEFQATSDRRAQIVEEYREATIGRHAYIRDIFKDLTDENKERINRSDKSSRDARINRVIFEKAQNASKEDQMKQATLYRTEAFRERVAGQIQVEELNHLLNLSLRSTPSSRCGSRAASAAIGNRMQTILTDLGVSIPVTVGATEGSDGENNPGVRHKEFEGSHLSPWCRGVCCSWCFVCI